MPAASFADRGFTPRFSTNDSGDIAIAANTLMTCPTAAAKCVSGRAGEAQNNNNFTMGYVDIDSDATTFDSSSSNLRLPAGATVLFAGLYWGADASAGSGGVAARDTSANVRGTVLLKTPGATAYKTLGPTGTVLDNATGANASRYGAFLDVTSLVKAAGAGNYTVANVQAGTGADRYAGWSLVVAYRDTTMPPRNLTIFDGFKTIQSSEPPTSISLSGFTTPPAGPVKTTLGFVTYEGDKGLVNDTASLNGKGLSDANSPATNFFNSSISERGVDRGEREPNYSNQLGFDADLLTADGILGNEATSATIGLTTSGDAYFPAAVTFATDIYAPNINSTQSFENVTNPGGPTRRGDVLQYTVNYKNEGQDGADAFIARDSIPAGVTYVPGSLKIVSGTGAGALTDASGDDRAEYEAENRRVTFRLGTGGTATAAGRIAAGASTSFSFRVKVDPTVIDKTPISNQATARYFGQTLGTPLSDVSPTVSTTVAAPDLTMAMSHEPALVSGAKTVFAIDVANSGTLATDGTPVTVTDTLPAAGFDSIAVKSAPGWSCTVTGLELSCTRTDALAAGALYPRIEVEALVHDPVPASVTNTAVVAGGGDSDASNNTATDVGTGSGASDLQLVGRATSTTVASGRPATYEWTVRNGGPSVAHGVVFEQPLGADFKGGTATVVGAAGECTGTVTCTIPTLAAGEEATIRVVATVAANATTISSTATVAAAEPADPVASNNGATVEVEVPNTADLALSASASPEHPQAGAPGALTYTLTLSNRGPGVAGTITVVDTLPEQFTPTSISAPGFTCNTPAAGGLLRCLRPTLTAAEGPVTITAVGTVAANAGAATLFNSARVRAETLDPEAENNQASNTTLPDGAVDLELITQGPAARVPVGENGTFTFTTKNNGPADAGPTTVIDKLPAGLEFVSGGPGCSYSTATRDVTCTVATLPSGQQQVSTVTVTPMAGTSGEVIPNTASVDTPTTDPIPSNNTSTDSLAVTPVADLSLTATLSPPKPKAGEKATLTLGVHNGGPNAAAGVKIVDQVPPGFIIGAVPSQCALSGRTITCTLGEIANGADQAVAIELTPEGSVIGESPVNTATLESTTSDPSPSDNTVKTSIPVAPPTQSGGGGSGGEGGNGGGETGTGTGGDNGTGTGGNNGGSGSGSGSGGNGSTGGGNGNDGGGTGNGPEGRGPGPGLGTVPRGRLLLKVKPNKRQIPSGGTFRYRIKVRTVGPIAVDRIRVCAKIPRSLTLVGARKAKITNHRRMACWRVEHLGPNKKRKLIVKVKAKPASVGRVRLRVRAKASNAPRRTLRAKRVKILGAR
jgi:uncharacterized repeat protein (TIGR01451 family)